MQDLPRGPRPSVLGGWASCMPRSDLIATHDVAMQAFAKGDRGHALIEKKNKWCNLVRFGAYFHNFFILKKSKNVYFLYKNNDKL